MILPTSFRLLSNVKYPFYNLYLPAMSATEHKYVLLTGSDLGDRKLALENAASLIHEQIGEIISRSAMHESEPWGFESSTKFLNQALLVKSSLAPEEALNNIQAIETSMGRQRTNKQYVSRIIDIDILCIEDRIYNTERLSIPHRFLHERSFALIPLCQVVPEWTHPLLGKSYLQLMRENLERSTSEKAS